MGMGVKAGVVGLLALIWFAVSEKIIGAVIKATKSLTGG
jgi:hypothetical protein